MHLCLGAERADGAVYALLHPLSVVKSQTVKCTCQASACKTISSSSGRRGCHQWQVRTTRISVAHLFGVSTRLVRLRRQSPASPAERCQSQRSCPSHGFLAEPSLALSARCQASPSRPHFIRPRGNLDKYILSCNTIPSLASYISIFTRQLFYEFNLLVCCRKTDKFFFTSIL